MIPIKLGPLDRDFLRIATVLVGINTLLNMAAFFAEDYAPDEQVEWLRIVVNELTGGFTVLILLIPLLVFFKEYPINRDQLWTRILLHLVGTAVYGICFFSIMYGQRFILYPILNLRMVEVFNNLHIRFLMEFAKLIFYYWVWYVGYHFYQLYREKQQHELALKEMENKLLDSELKALQNRLNPHFFFNTLNVISSLMYDNPEKADKLIVQLSSFLRKVIGFHEHPIHTLEDELILTDQYLDLMKGRYEDNLRLHKHIGVADKSYMIPALTFQPFLENAIQYTLNHRAPAEIEFSIQTDNSQLICKILDNGPGISDSKDLQQGVGIPTVLERLRKWYGESFYAHIQNRQKGGVEVLIQIPIRK